MRERDFLDLLWARYAYKKSLGDAPRYLVAEHPRTPLGDSNNMRVLDCLVLDRHRLYPKAEYVRDADGHVHTRYAHPPLFPVLGFEVKTSRADWLRELKNLSKAQAWQRYCSHFFVVAPRGVVRDEEVPVGWGVMVPRGIGLMITHAPTLNANPESMPTEAITAITYAAIKTDRAHR